MHVCLFNQMPLSGLRYLDLLLCIMNLTFILFQVNERPVSVNELLDADEVFCTGTAVVVNPVGSITHGTRR